MASTEEQTAVAATKLAGLKKQLNAESWSDNMETLLESWGEKGAGLRFMHNSASAHWRGVANKLTLWSIIITSIASGVSLVATSIDDEEAKNGVLYAVGAIGIVSSFLQSYKKFKNAEEKSAEHGAIAKQFGSFYRYMTLQLGMSRGDRVPADQLSEWCLKEFERMQMEALPLSGREIKLFKEKFKSSEQSVPDVCEDKFIIKVYRDPPEVEVTAREVATEAE